MSAVRTTPKCRAKIMQKNPLPQNAMEPVAGKFIQNRWDSTVKFQPRNKFFKFVSSVFKQSPPQTQNRLQPVFDFSSVFSSKEREGYAYLSGKDRRRSQVYYRTTHRLRKMGFKGLKRMNEYGYAKFGDRMIQLYVDGETKSVKWTEINVSTGYLLIDGPPMQQR
jgi:hypothetical protein